MREMHSMHKGKCSINDCNNYRGISLLSIPGKVYESPERDKVTEDQTFAIKMMIEEYLGEG